MWRYRVPVNPAAARREFEHRKAFRAKIKWRTGCEGRINHLKRSYGWNRTELTTLTGPGPGADTASSPTTSSRSAPWPPESKTERHRRPGQQPPHRNRIRPSTLFQVEVARHPRFVVVKRPECRGGFDGVPRLCVRRSGFGGVGSRAGCRRGGCRGLVVLGGGGLRQCGACRRRCGRRGWRSARRMPIGRSRRRAGGCGHGGPARRVCGLTRRSVVMFRRSFCDTWRWCTGSGRPRTHRAPGRRG